MASCLGLEIGIGIPEEGYDERETRGITAKVGQPVTIQLENDDNMDHALSIDGLNVESDAIGPNQATSFTFTPQQTGAYLFYYPLHGHAQLGMVGTFQVVS